MVDARTETTRRRLREALFSLATTRDVASISVSELTRAAGIDRSTFYAHASSTTQLLADLIREELDPLREAVEETLDRAPATLAAVGGGLNARLIDHVERYADVYATRERTINSALHAALTAHTCDSLRRVFDHLGVPVEEDERRYLSAFAGYGVVGAIATWLAEPVPRDRARLQKALDLVYSTWLVPASQTPSRSGGHPITGEPS